MRVIILGSAAGGGLPQWNCGCPNCTDARHDNRGRTQSSVAVSADGERWILLNASPDLRTQLGAHRALWPRREGGGTRGTPLRAVILTDGEIDHTLGLLLLRESATKLPVYAPAGVTALLGDQWPLYRVLSAYAGVEPRALPDGGAVALADAAGAPLGLSCRAAAVARRPPRYARAAPVGAFDVGVRLTDERTGGTLAYVPTAGAVDDAVQTIAAGADLLLFDGTFWSDSELVAAGVDAPGAREMGHLPVGGSGGSLELLPRLGAKRTVLVHINNTNPMLCPTSAERAQVEAAGIAVGEDGMEFEAGRGDGRAARRARQPVPAASGRTFRGGRLRELLPHEAVARGGRRVAHRDVRAAHREGAARGDPQPLHVGGPRRAPVLQESPDPGAA